MKILLLGSGGREHAMAWKISKSAQCSTLYIAPGNPGTAECGENINLAATDFDKLAAFCIDKKIDMVVVGPEDPLVNGVVDYFAANDLIKHIPVIGPNKMAAQMEGSKTFAKAFMQRNNVQTPAYKEFSKENIDAAIHYIDEHALPIVLKADGLAAGKGVIICDTHEQAISELQLMMSGKFGEAGNKVVIEQFLTGVELTVIILTDGENYLMLPPSKDYKKIGDGDTGLNTGGMGAISPPAFATEDFLQKVKEKIIHPTLNGLKKENIEYKGFLYFGLFKCGDEPYVIEYNARLGDPETQVILPRIKNDILDLFKAVAENNLGSKKLETDERACATVILASHGYPSAFEKGKIITGMENTEDCLLFHAATKTDETNNLITSGGRVLAVTSYGKNLSEALLNCYVNAGRIYFESRYFRRDIGWDI
ncbi:MAG: phosphoribosylamine--glycine ligase [Fimbriimonadaceae bacterium]|nr:phosphoribosylamine--glycine ligase [Chitinophagales bacterium]